MIISSKPETNEPGVILPPPQLASCRSPILAPTNGDTGIIFLEAASITFPLLLLYLLQTVLSLFLLLLLLPLSFNLALMYNLFCKQLNGLIGRRRVRGKKSGKQKATEEHPDEGVANRGQWSSTDDPERTVDLEFCDKHKPVFDLDDLLRSSAEVLGNGKLGTTYKATLESGMVVAVKRVKEMNSFTKKEFVQQMQLLGKLKHPNLVEIVSFYYSKEEKLIIHEFIQDGSLFALLHENRGFARVPLNWTTRVQIMTDVAKGLIFLNQSLSSQKVAHGNLKSSNVLINFTETETVHAKLTDYGYFPLLHSRRSFEKLAIGKCPEFVEGKKMTHKADVYCFGILLLEAITGNVPGENHEDLSDWVRGVLNSDWSMDIFDVELLAEKEWHEDMLKLAELALDCTHITPERRPKMSQILIRLQEIHPKLT